MRVLAADDDPEVRLLLELALSGDPATVTTLVSSGQEALHRASAERYDVILLDGLMPGLDGAETCRRLKDDPKSAMVPVIFLTALSSAESRAELEAAGATGFIAKPFDPFRLLEQIRLVLAR